MPKGKGYPAKKETVRKLKGMTIDAKKMRKSEGKKAKKTLQQIFDDNTNR